VAGGNHAKSADENYPNHELERLTDIVQTQMLQMQDVIDNHLLIQGMMNCFTILEQHCNWNVDQFDRQIGEPRRTLS
jgi:hypothetical protein